MDLSEDHKTELEAKIVEVIAGSLEDGKLKEEDLPEIADFVLKRIGLIKVHEELVAFLYNLSAKWLVFDNLEDIERGEEKDNLEDDVERQALDLAKSGKVEEAIALTKSMTD